VEKTYFLDGLILGLISDKVLNVTSVHSFYHFRFWYSCSN